MTSPTLVILESPFAGNWLERRRNIRYARACVRDSLSRGEAPIASHLLYTQPGILLDGVPAERSQGIEAGLAWREVASGAVVYTDLGITAGMRFGRESMLNSGRTVEHRTLPVMPRSPRWERTLMKLVDLYRTASMVITTN